MFWPISPLKNKRWPFFEKRLGGKNSQRKLFKKEKSPNFLFSSPKNKVKRKRALLLFLGIIFFVAGLFLSSNFLSSKSPSSPELLANSFSQEPVRIEKNFFSEKTLPKKGKKHLPPLRIVIPSVGIDLPIKEAKVIKGYWEVFPDSAGFGLGSAYPDEEGNQVIFAHARKGLFLPLKDVHLKDKIYILTQEKWYLYEVEKIKEVFPTETEVISSTSSALLTLYTCSGFADSKRLIVAAKKISSF